MESTILQTALVTIIQVLLPVVLVFIVTWINLKIKEIKGQMNQADLEFAGALVRQLVLAAEQNGLTGALEAVGAEKKKYVIALAEAELERQGIKIDLDVLDALVEAACMEAFSKIEI